MGHPCLEERPENREGAFADDFEAYAGRAGYDDRVRAGRLSRLEEEVRDRDTSCGAAVAEVLSEALQVGTS